MAASSIASCIALGQAVDTRRTGLLAGLTLVFGAIGWAEIALPIALLSAGVAGAVGAFLFGIVHQGGQFFEALAVHVAGFVDHGQPALGADGAQQGVDDVDGPRHVEGVVVARVHPAGMPENSRRILGKILGEPQKEDLTFLRINDRPALEKKMKFPAKKPKFLYGTTPVFRFYVF